MIHLKAGGVLLVVAKTEETFQNNNFAYTGEKDGVQVTLFENNYINPLLCNTYEATFVYLIRQKGELTIHTDRQLLGLFSQVKWENHDQGKNHNFITQRWPESVCTRLPIPRYLKGSASAQVFQV